jgi:transposase-like protein
MQTEFSSLVQLVTAIPDEDTAVAYFTAIRWKNGQFCPYCGATKIIHFGDKKTYKCSHCRQRFSIKVGTVFEGTKIPMRKWLMAIWLITSHKKGIASTTLARDLQVTQKSAWFMLHRLRQAAATKGFNQPLKGVVEIDETFVGGKAANKHRNDARDQKKAVVLGMLERGGELRAKVQANMRKIPEEVLLNVEIKATVMTDEWGGYNVISPFYNHATVCHSRGEYGRGPVHVNGIEGAWGLLKRQIYGIHHFVSHKHLGRYVSEMTWRYNRRDMNGGTRVAALISGSDGRLTYKALIA